MSLKSIQVEKHVIGGLIQNPEIIAEIERWISDRDFTADPHSVVYECIRSSFLRNEKIDKVLIAQQIQNLGISFKDDINIFDYIDSISYAPISKEATLQACQELVKLRILRDISNNCGKIQAHLEQSVSQPVEKTVAEADAMYSTNITKIEYEDAPENLFSEIYNLVEERGNNPYEEVGMITPYPEFNRLYGGVRGGNIYAIASRPKQGKTTWLNYTCAEIGRMHKCPVLFLDTEMSTQEIRFRTAASISGVPVWYLETGMWRKNPEFVERVRKHLKEIEGQYKVYHYHVGNKNIDELCSIIRHWVLTIVGRGKKCVVCYDYLKLTGEKLSNFWAEHQALGGKVDKLKRISEEFDFPLFTAIQLNRSGENTNRESHNVVDDGSAISLSDRLQWFTTYLGIFRRRTTDELTLDTKESGTHKLIEIAARFQGKDAVGHQDMLLREFPDGKKRYVKNFLNFDIQNFKVEERGSLKDAIQRQKAMFLAHDKQPEKIKVIEETL